MEANAGSIAHNVEPHVGYWRGLGLWNLYFIAKLGLYWAGALNFNALYNLAFAAAVLLPLRSLYLHRLRHALMVPVGAALLYYDSWLPPFSRLLAQPEILKFSPHYLLELMGRLVNWDMVGAGVILLVVYLFLAQWLRLTVFTLGALSYVALSGSVIFPFGRDMEPINTPEQAQLVSAQSGNSQYAAQSATPTQPGKPSNVQLNEALSLFYQVEQDRTSSFNSSGAVAPFDLVFISICSLSWSDLEASNLAHHPLIGNMDVVFDNFNSATGYSGPAVLRLLRASCGQPSHAALYQPTDDHCYLFENLKHLGFDTQTALNHDGKFDGFLDELTKQGHFPQPSIPTDKRPVLTAFDGSPIWDDYSTLAGWWENRKQASSQPAALLYNTITLHDGNREATADGGGRSAPYETRARKMLDQLNAFIGDLERSGRPVVLVLVPEHGAALKADRVQISGMREIPSTAITRVPVAVRVIGAQRRPGQQALHVAGPSSYLALSELISRLVRLNISDKEGIDWPLLVSDLPITQPISENEGSVFMKYGEVPYVRMGNRNWIEYPQ